MDTEAAGDLLAIRRKKMEAIATLGENPFGARFDVPGTISDVRQSFVEGRAIRAAGRITAHRNMGKSHFLDLSDFTGRIQIFVHAKEIGEARLAVFDNLDL
ncbi:MAG: hypothetical protein WEB60_04595, partial [Terrimicrobiaceae bacterium]